MFFRLLNSSSFLIYLVATVSALFVAMPFHEFAHAYAAKKEGDYTAYASKRYTLAPLAHIDMKGFLCLMIFGFGWAKPVPVDSRNFKHGRKSQFRIAIAGVVMNFLLGTAFLFIYILLVKFLPQVFSISVYGELLYSFLIVSISFNFMFMIFNLLPLYPLDGYNILDSFFRQENDLLIFLKKYSIYIYLFLAFTGIFSTVYLGIMNFLINNLTKFFVMILGG